MTYKAIVKGMIERKSQKWVESLLAKNHIEYKRTSVDCCELENSKKEDVIYWNTRIKIVDPDYNYIFLDVGGTADDICGICTSVIWNEEHRIIWMHVKETRNQLNITEFKIA